jgi:hypothetical protein
VLLVASLGCQTTRGELVAFTESQRLRYELDEQELRALQYYLSDRIVLERVAKEGTSRVKRGQLIVRSGTAIQQVYVERGTRGAVEAHGQVGDGVDGRYGLEISFELGAPLRFAPTSEGTYSLAGPARGGLLGLLLFGGSRPRFEVEFDGAKWQVVEGADSRILIERDALGKLARTRRTLPGVRVPDAR